MKLSNVFEKFDVILQRRTVDLSTDFFSSISYDQLTRIITVDLHDSKALSIVLLADNMHGVVR